MISTGQEEEGEDQGIIQVQSWSWFGLRPCDPGAQFQQSSHWYIETQLTEGVMDILAWASF